MSICPLDEQRCPSDIQMSIRPLDEQKCPLDIQMSIRLLDEWTNGHQGRQSWGGWGGTRPPQFLEWGGRISNCPPHFFICSMKFNSKLFSVYCGHCLSLSILLNIIQIQTRSHMLTQSCFFSNFLRCYCLIIESR